jgi:hypothetical protein
MVFGDDIEAGRGGCRGKKMIAALFAAAGSI